VNSQHPSLSVKDLTKTYRSRSGPVEAVGGVTFSVAKGELVGLLGPNGAGKTTTIKSICTLIRPTSGSIEIQGIDALKHPRKAVENVAAVLEGNRNIYWRLTTRENMELFAGMQGISKKKVSGLITELLERFDLVGKATTEARKLSRGMQQKLAVACAIVKKTPIVLLDEPTLGLDVETSHELRVSLRAMAAEEGTTVLLSSHDMDVVQDVCDRVIIISDGKMVADDGVANLLEVFKARAYAFELSTPLTESQSEELMTLYPGTKLSDEGMLPTVEVALPEAGAIYHLMDLFRGYGCTIESIDRKDPDLEEIFLHFVRGQR